MKGFVYKQNYRIWALENPHVILQRQLHPRRVTIWCEGVLRPYVIKDAATVTGERYLVIVQKFLGSQIQQEIFYELSGAFNRSAWRCNL